MPNRLSVTVSVPLPFTVSIPWSSASKSAKSGGVCNVVGGFGAGGGEDAGLTGGGGGLTGGDVTMSLSPNKPPLFVEPAPTVTPYAPPAGVVIVKSENG